jgi:hypothetical protein
MNIVKVIIGCFLIVLIGCSDAEKPKVINDYLVALEHQGVSIGKKQEKIYQLIMATDGFSIQINDASIEIYQFDLSVGSGRAALANVIENGLMGKAVITNKNLVLLKNEKHKDWDKLNKIFQSI